ncbi:GyrI-like domain-containing protein [Microtetraspora niveoalba]|uniref:GyrI-like domain-containing protein n=1 Tax=Microtetraspora niveoalba TaxID=46175 RepID=UPI00082DF5B3|nr:GyrI-like domain-containing protein [Microtetraspora niveoalba]
MTCAAAAPPVRPAPCGEEGARLLFLRVPDGMDPEWADRAREAARDGAAPVDRVQLATFTEGRCVQITHHGSFADEHLSLGKMGAFMDEHGLVPNGLHHEIYLSGVDPTADPSTLRTVLRQPVRPA